MPPTPQRAPAPQAHAPAAVVMNVVLDEVTEPLPGRRSRQARGPSRLARFLGRWTPSGHFRPASRVRVPARGGDDDLDLEIPRDRTGRHVLLVLLVALLTFLVTFALVRHRQRVAPSPGAASSQR